MRLIAQRVGPEGSVLGVDKDAALVAPTTTMLHEAGHHHCEVRAHDLTVDALPDQRFDLVYARLLLFHLPNRVDVLRTLWAAVAPGGHLVLQDYDLTSAKAHPPLASVEAVAQVITDAFATVGCDTAVGSDLPELLRRADIGSPDGTDVAGRLEPLAEARPYLEQTFRSLLPLALARDVLDEPTAAELLAALDDDTTRYPERPILLPLLIGAWKSKPC